jgi:hypothetical protein
MAFRRKKQRDLGELQTDPHFPFYVGRLVGAAEMTSHWLQLQPDNYDKDMGKRLAMVVGWFLTDEVLPVDQNTVPTLHTEEFPTQVKNK